MSYCLASIKRSTFCFATLGFLTGLAIVVASLDTPAAAQTQGKGTKAAGKTGDTTLKRIDKGSDPLADAAKGADGDEPDAQPQQLDAKLLIGDAVDDADSPQYRKVTQAIDKFRDRRVKEARDLLEEARTNHPQLPPAEVLIAKLFIVFRQPQLALGELEQAVKRYPKDPESYLMLADGSLAEQRVTAAEALYQKADAILKSFDENAKRKENFNKRILHGLAAVAESRQQWAAAESLLRQLIKADTKNAGAHQRLGRALFQQAPLGAANNAKLKESYDEFMAAVQADPKAIKPDVAMGQLFEQAAQEAQAAGNTANFKDYRDRATTFFERATRPQSADLNSLLAAATWALQSNQSGLAKQYAEAATKMDPDSLEAKQMRALVARFSGDMATAEKLLNDAFIQSPGNFGISNQLALVLIESNDKQKQNRALQLAEVNARQYQNSAEAASTLGWVYYNMGRAAEAQRALQAVVNSRQISSDAAFYLATMLENQGRVNEALQILQEALANPQPFANRSNATNLAQRLRERGDSSKDDSREEKTSTSTKRDSGDTKPGTKTKGGK
jgi:tetratricopeptide (TPR) repeat protein